MLKCALRLSAIALVWSGCLLHDVIRYHHHRYRRYLLHMPYLFYPKPWKRGVMMRKIWKTYREVIIIAIATYTNWYSLSSSLYTSMLIPWGMGRYESRYSAMARYQYSSRMKMPGTSLLGRHLRYSRSELPGHILSSSANLTCCWYADTASEVIRH